MGGVFVHESRLDPELNLVRPFLNCGSFFSLKEALHQINGRHQLNNGERERKWVRRTSFPMYWKLNETPLGAFHFKHAHWKPSFFPYLCIPPAPHGFSHLCIYNAVIGYTSWQFQLAQFIFVQMMVVKQTYYSRMELSDDWTTEELTLAAHNIISKEGWR